MVVRISIGLICLFVAATSVNAAVIFYNDWQYVEVSCSGDDLVLLSDDHEANGSGDAELEAITDLSDLTALAWASLSTGYGDESLHFSGDLHLEASLLDATYAAVSAHATVYYQVAITVTDVPVWVNLIGEFNTPNYEANDHFVILSPVFWAEDEGPEGAFTDFDEDMLLDVGIHYFYGAIDYDLTATDEGEYELDADYSFVLTVIPEPTTLSLLALMTAVAAGHRRYRL